MGDDDRAARWLCTSDISPYYYNAQLVILSGVGPSLYMESILSGLGFPITVTDT